MSLGGSLSGITFGGLSSGIDTTSIIQRLSQIEQIPIQRLQTRQQSLQDKKSVYSALQTALSTLGTKASSLNVANSFSTFSASSSATDVATVSLSGDTSTSGLYSLTVDKLAQAHKLSSGAKADVSSALGYSGSFVVNGKAVAVTASDSLTTIAQKVNSVNSGVTASLINGGTGNAFLTFTSNATGISGKVQLADVNGGVLSSLGVVSGAAVIRESITNGATSTSFSNQTTAIGGQINTTIPAANIQINGTTVAINTATDSLQQIANNINAAGAGVTATVRSITNNSVTTYKLDIVGASGTPTFVDDQNVLQSIGVLQQGYGSELVQAQDAQFKLDGVSLTNSSNTVTSAIPGATITLLKQTTTSGGTTTTASSNISISKDLSSIKSKISDFTSAYNGVLDFISQYSQLDSTTFQTGPLFGDSVAQQVESQLGSVLFNNVEGLTGKYTNLTSIGFGLDENAKITVDDAKLTQALTEAPESVAALFKAVGTPSNNNLAFVSSTSKTKASGVGNYAVNITQLATKGAYAGETAQTSASTVAETLTFGGNLFSNTPYKLTVASGSTAGDTVNLINNDATLKNLVTASLDGSGKLQIVAKKFGVNGNFTAVSSLTAAADNSGLGVGSLGTTVAGVDVAGTINGEAATGSGQFLTGNTGNATTEGLQIQFTGSSTGAAGNIQFTKGIAPIYNDIANQFTDATNGLLAASTKSLQDQYDFLQIQVDEQTASVTKHIADLKAKYAAMDQAIANYQAQGQRLSAMFSTGN